MIYITGTQGRLFRGDEDNFIRSTSGKKLKYLYDTDENRLLKEEDLKELVFVNYLPDGYNENQKPTFEVIYPEDRKVYVTEME